MPKRAAPRPATTKTTKKPPKRRAVPRPARLRLETEERRAQLVALGLERFGSKAYDDVSIDDIAEAAGISKGLLYHYFPTKRAYYVAVIRAAAGELVRACMPDESAPPLAQLYEGLGAYLAYVKAHARAYATLMRSGVGADREIARVVDETRALFIDKLVTGMPVPSPEPHSPLLAVALRGWIGLVEASALHWTEALASRAGAAESDGPEAPTASELRDLLVAGLTSLVEHALARAPKA